MAMATCMFWPRAYATSIICSLHLRPALSLPLFPRSSWSNGPQKTFRCRIKTSATKPLMRVASPWRRFRTRRWISTVLGRASTPRMNSQLWAFRSLWLIIGARSDAQHRETAVRADRQYLRQYESILSSIFSLRCGGDVRVQHAQRIQRGIATPRLRTAPVSCSRGQNGGSQSALWWSHRLDLQTAQHAKHRLLVARRCAEFAKSVYLHPGASEPPGGGEELGRFPSRSGMAKGEGRIGGARSTGGSYRPVFHGSDELLGAQVGAVAEKLNGANGKSDIEGKATRVVSKLKR